MYVMMNKKKTQKKTKKDENMLDLFYQSQLQSLTG